MATKRSRSGGSRGSGTGRGRSGESALRRGSSAKTKTTRRARHIERVTTDHDEIRRWTEERGGIPARVKGTGGDGDVGIIRIAFPGAPNARDESFEEISWDEFFKQCDKQNIALVYDETTAEGQKSYFCKLVKRDTAQKKAAKSRSASRRSK
jgi:hypothetical protein